MPVSLPPISAAAHCGRTRSTSPTAASTPAPPSLATPAPTTASCSPTLSAATVAAMCWPPPLRHILSGRRRTLTAAPFLATDDLWLDTDPPLPLDIDGEIRGHTPVRIRIAPNALRVMVTPDFPDT